MSDDLVRLIIVFLSLLTIPYLLLLLKVMLTEKTNGHAQKSTRLVLTMLFSLMLAGSLMSLIISLLSIFPNFISINGNINVLSRTRTLLLTIGNFFLALHFYHIHNGK